MGRFNKYTQTPVDADGLKMPDSRNIEAQLLTDIIYKPEMLNEVRSMVKREMFTQEAFLKAWDLIIRLDQEGVTLDINTICSRLDQNTREILLNRTGFDYQGTMDHCRVFVELATRRLVFIRASEMMRMAGDPGSDFSRMYSLPGELASALIEKSSVGKDSRPVTSILNAYEDELQDRANGKIRRIPTGFHRLDKMTMGGWTNGNLIVMSARPSVGKSSIMCQMAVSASRAGFPVTVYSLEMPECDLAQRLLFATGYISDLDVFNDKKLQSLDWNNLEMANKVYDNLPLWFNARLRTLDEICNDIVMQHQRGRCAIAFIDHLHIVSGPDSQLSTVQAITERTRRFKELAMNCGIPVVLLSQLNRLSDMENRPPELRDLRSSGSIEQDADIVLMLDRHTKGLNDPRVDMWIRKSRNGLAGDVCVPLNGDVSRAFTVFTERDESLDKGLDDYFNKNSK